MVELVAVIVILPEDVTYTENVPVPPVIVWVSDDEEYRFVPDKSVDVPVVHSEEVWSFNVTVIVKSKYAVGVEVLDVTVIVERTGAIIVYDDDEVIEDKSLADAII
jgi:hypothetical protein